MVDERFIHYTWYCNVRILTLFLLNTNMIKGKSNIRNSVLLNYNTVKDKSNVRKGILTP